MALTERERVPSLSVMAMLGSEVAVAGLDDAEGRTAAKVSAVALQGSFQTGHMDEEGVSHRLLDLEVGRVGEVGVLEVWVGGEQRPLGHVQGRLEQVQGRQLRPLCQVVRHWYLRASHDSASMVTATTLV